MVLLLEILELALQEEISIGNLKLIQIFSYLKFQHLNNLLFCSKDNTKADSFFSSIFMAIQSKKISSYTAHSMKFGSLTTTALVFSQNSFPREPKCFVTTAVCSGCLRAKRQQQGQSFWPMFLIATQFKHPLVFIIPKRKKRMCHSHLNFGNKWGEISVGALGNIFS